MECLRLTSLLCQNQGSDLSAIRVGKETCAFVLFRKLQRFYLAYCREYGILSLSLVRKKCQEPERGYHGSTDDGSRSTETERASACRSFCSGRSTCWITRLPQLRRNIVNGVDMAARKNKQAFPPGNACFSSYSRRHSTTGGMNCSSASRSLGWRMTKWMAGAFPLDTMAH